MGRPSRAEFPLNAEFAKGSTNSAVGLSGHAKVIDDVAAYTAEGGGFYVCDDAVQSEACLPIFDEAGKIIGIIDAEASPKAFFNSDRLSNLVAMAPRPSGIESRARLPHEVAIRHFKHLAAQLKQPTPRGP